MSRLNIERQQQIEPKRIEFAVENISALGLEITGVDKTKIIFIFNGSPVTFFPYSGWHTGKTIKDGRGWNNLQKQLTLNQ